MRSISRDTSWTHALAVRRAQEHFLHIRQGHDAGEVDLDRFFLQVSEFLFWVCIADEGFKLVALGQGDDYEQVDEIELSEFLADLENTYE